ncbi:hypothetical protein K438DRAFT_1995760 [Mycena galopus ATCC 62051]|nr:hypothetical protein K438DRAFT_1995760 [Mycena galopus ATCC 62051]
MLCELPITALSAAFIIVIPLLGHWCTHNVPTLSIITWLFVSNIILDVNAIIWRQAIEVAALAWCDLIFRLPPHGVHLHPSDRSRLGPQLVVVALMCGYAGTALTHFFRCRLPFACHLASQVQSHSALTPSRYQRLVGMALTQMFWATALTCQPRAPPVGLLNLRAQRLLAHWHSALAFIVRHAHRRRHWDGD